MASFTGQLSDPQAPRESVTPNTGWAGALSGAVDAVNDFGKGLDDLNKRTAGNDVAKSLSALVIQNDGKVPSPQSTALAGEPPTDPVAAASQNSPVVRATLGQLDRLNQAKQQGALDPQELMTRSSVIVQDAVNANPRYAQEIRAAAAGVLGVTPTADLVSMAARRTQASETMANQVKMDNVTAAAHSGVTFLNPDGSVDLDRMDQAGQKLQFQEKQISDAMRQASLVKEQAGVKPTHDEVIAAQVDPFIKGANPHASEVNDGMLASVPALVAQLQNQGKDAQIAGVLNAIGVQQTSFNNWLNSQIFKNNVSPEAAAQLRTYYNQPFEQYKTLAASGDFSSFSTTAATLKASQDRGVMNFRDAVPAGKALQDAGGQAAMQAYFQVFLGTNTAARSALDHDVGSFIDGTKAAPATAVVANGASALSGGGYQLHAEQNPVMQQKVLKGLVGTLNAYTAKPNSLTPVESNAFGHVTNQITALGLQSEEPKNLSSAANLVNSPAALATFDAYAKDPAHANNMPIVASGMLALNTKSIQRNTPLLVQGQTVTISSSNPQANPTSHFPNPHSDISVTASVAFNPVTGKAETVLSAADPNGKSYNLTPNETATVSRQFGDFNGQVANLNRSLDAVAHLAPYGIGREKDFKPLELRQLITRQSGMPVKPGTNAVPMPAFMGDKNVSADDIVPDWFIKAQIKQESGGQSQADMEAKGIASNQGAVGPAQIRPASFPQYDAQKLRGDTPEDYKYALNAQKEIMTGLVKKYHGNLALAAAEYHGGPNRANWGDKTHSYVGSILSANLGE